MSRPSPHRQALSARRSRSLRGFRPSVQSLEHRTLLATFLGTDTITRGDWSPAYGSAGYQILGGGSSLPAYATVTPANQDSATWNASTDDPRALRVAPGSASRVASCWYGSTFTADVNIADGQTHEVSLYLLDWDRHYERSEQIDLVDPATGTTLDTRTASGFDGGQYLNWTSPATSRSASPA